jgi:transcriptional antiterminator RfaH
MPLIAAERCLFPDDLLTSPPTADSSARWWVLHSRPRAEKALARNILAQSGSFFLPLYRRQWRSRGRLLSSELPLFTGYLFLYGNETTRLMALTTNLVVNCLKVHDQTRLQSDLARVWRLMTSEQTLTPEPRIQPGQRVDIVAGPLAGLSGQVLRRGKSLTLVVEVQLLQRGVSVEIEEWMLQPARVGSGRTDAGPGSV